MGCLKVVKEYMIMNDCKFVLCDYLIKLNLGIVCY